MSRTSRRRIADESGAEAVELALTAPLALLAIFALIYGLVTVAAYVSLTHAASVAVRYASIPVDPVHGVYRTPAEVQDELVASSPFFSAGDCSTAVTGAPSENSPIVLDVDCTFPNPLGRVVNALGSIASGRDEQGPHPEGDLTLSVLARGRRE